MAQAGYVPAVTFYRNDAPRYIGAKNLCAKILKAAGQGREAYRPGIFDMVEEDRTQRRARDEG